MAPFDAVILLARYLAAAIASNDDAAFFGVDLDLIAPQPGKFGGQDERAVGFIEIHRRRPPRRIGADQLTDLIVKSEQIAQRIPAREGHIAS